MDFEHILVGPGKFGLGCVGLLAHEAGWNSLYIARGPSSSDPEAVERNTSLLAQGKYLVSLPAREITVDSFQFKAFDFRKPDPYFLEAFRSERLQLVSVCTPANAIDDVAIILAHGFKARWSEPWAEQHPISVLPCINAPDSGQELFVSFLKICRELSDNPKWLDHVGRLEGSFLNCIVDRVCDAIQVDEGAVRVTAEEFCMLVVQEPLSPALLKLKESHLGNIIETADLKAWQRAKYWGVNGLLLFLAAAAAQVSDRAQARSGSAPWLEMRFSVLLQNPSVAEAARKYVSEVEATLRLVNGIGSEETRRIRAYLSNVITRVSDGRDTPARILRELRLGAMNWDEQVARIDANWPLPTVMGEERRVAISRLLEGFLEHALLEFLDKLRERVVKPARLLRETGLTPMHLHHALALIMSVLVDASSIQRYSTQPTEEQQDVERVVQ